MEMAGIPAHAWVTGTADYVLVPACWVERIGTEMASKADMGRFSVVARTGFPERVARELVLGILQPPAPYDTSEDDLRVPRAAMVPQAVSVLDYPVVVHLLRIEDMEAFTDISDGGGSSGDDSNDPRHDLGGGPPRRPRTIAFQCQRGVVDGDLTPRGGAAAGGGSSAGWSRADLTRLLWWLYGWGFCLRRCQGWWRWIFLLVPRRWTASGWIPCAWRRRFDRRLLSGLGGLLLLGRGPCWMWWRQAGLLRSLWRGRHRLLPLRLWRLPSRSAPRWMWDRRCPSLCLAILSRPSLSPCWTPSVLASRGGIPALGGSRAFHPAVVGGRRSGLC